MTGQAQGGSLTVVAIPDRRCVLGTGQVVAVAGRPPLLPRNGKLSEGDGHR